MINLNINDNKQFELKIEIPKDFIDDVTKIVFDEQKNQWDKEISYDGSKVAELSPKYVEWKRKKGYSTKIFQMTGKMKQSLTIDKVNNNTREIYISGDRDRIMAILQRGDKPMRGARRGFGISNKTLMRIDKLFRTLQVKWQQTKN